MFQDGNEFPFSKFVSDGHSWDLNEYLCLGQGQARWLPPSGEPPAECPKRGMATLNWGMSLIVGGAFLKGSSVLMGAGKTIPMRNNCTQLLLWFAAAPFWEHTVGLAKAESKHCHSLAIPLKTCVYPASKSTQPSNCKETCGQHYILMTSPCVSVSEWGLFCLQMLFVFEDNSLQTGITSAKTELKESNWGNKSWLFTKAN